MSQGILTINTRKAAFRKRLYARLVAPIIPALIGQAAGLPPIDSETVSVEAADFICKGPVEIFLAMFGGTMALDLLCLAIKRKRLKVLPLEAQKEFLVKAFKSRFWALRGLTVLASLPVKVVYYNQSHTCEALGYDRAALIEDALKHQVSREKQALSA